MKPVIKFKTFSISKDFELWQKENNETTTITNVIPIMDSQCDDFYNYGVMILFYENKE